MSFIFTNPDLNSQITQIKKQIYLLMNGEISASMEKHGLSYSKNYGLNIHAIKGIAKQYEQNHDLAQRLWFLDIRECMILATMLQPADQFTPDMATQWLEKAHNIELIEQLSINLLRHLPYAKKISIERVQSKDMNDKIIGYTLGAWLQESFSKEDIQVLLEECHKLDYQEDKTILVNKIALCLSKLTRKNQQIAALIYTSLDDFKQSENRLKSYIFNTVHEELIFLGYLNDDV